VLEAESHFSRQLLWTRPNVPVHSQGDMRFSLLSSVDKKCKTVNGNVSLSGYTLYASPDETEYHSFLCEAYF
jgi:hypothetical protein